jgi:GTPase Era involved in 16S rRNA processing
MTKSLNIILFGETGVGKSSLVNLIAGSEVAQTSGDSDGCTMTYRPYIFQVHGISYTIWDTRGLDRAETMMETKGYLAAVEQAYKLIQNLTALGGVDLLVLCHRAGRITTTTQSNYRLFYEVLCESNVPIALAITFLEHHTRMEDWWKQNVGVFERHEMKPAGHACVTGLSEHSMSQESRLAIENMLGQHDDNGRYNMPPGRWFAQFLRRLATFRGCPCPNGLKKGELEDFLRKRCGLGVRDARDVAGVIVGGRAG